MKKKFIAWIVTICIIGGGVVSGSFFAFNKTCLRVDWDWGISLEKASRNQFQAFNEAYYIQHGSNEKIEIRAKDNTKLVAHYYEKREKAPVIIFFPGYRGNSAYGSVPFYNAAEKLKWNALLITHRASGESGGRYSTLGGQEKSDCIEWVKWVKDHCGEDTPVYLAGVSMGASYILMASESASAYSVHGIISDCGFAGPIKIIDRGTKEKLPGWMPIQIWDFFLESGTRLFGKFSISQIDATEAIRKTSIPILYIHSDTDELAPLSEIYKLYNSEKDERVVLHGAAHGESYVTDPDTYSKAIINFMRKHE